MGRAGGFEVPENGSVAMGRGGAVVARASDPSTLATNVAGIVGLPGLQITLGSNFPLLSQCFAREGKYDGPPDTIVSVDDTIFEKGTQNYATVGADYPRICNKTELGVVPHLLATYRIGRQVAIGLGFYPPNSIASKHFPTEVATDAQIPDTSGTSVLTAPAPQRYMLISSEGVILYPTIALAFAPVPWLRLGGAVQPSFAHIKAATYGNASGGQSPSTDVAVDVDAKGLFFAGSFGVQAIATPNWSFGLHVHLSQIPRLRGKAAKTLNAYAKDENVKVLVKDPVENAEVDFVLPPVQARIGARFALPREGAVLQTDNKADQTYDPMHDDVFDVEANLIYERGSANQYFHVMTSTPESNFDYPRSTCPKTLVTDAITTDLCLPRYWRDVIGLRLGGDVNVVPDVLALRAGASFETGGQSTRGANLDSVAQDTLGMHMGATFRPTRWLSVHLAYAHYFMRDINASDGELTNVAQAGVVTAADCAKREIGPGSCTGNRGLYQSRLDMFNFGLTGHFF
jgi:long-chain fatty acid transport protein